MAPRSAKKSTVEDPVEVKKPRSKESAGVAEFDDLSALAMSTKEIEDEVRLQTGGGNTWVRILQPGVDVVTKGTADYVKGAEAGDFYIADKKILLKEPEVTVTGIFKVYAEKKPGRTKESDMAVTVGFWSPVDAEQIPLKDGNNFERVLRNGNILIPMHWMFVYIHEHPDIKDAMIPFQSVANSYCTEIAKLIKKNSSMSTQLRLKLSSVAVKNEDYNKTYFYPVAEIVGKNFDLDTETGRVSLCKGGLDAAELREVLTLSNTVLKEYKELKMVAKKSEQQLIAASPAAAIAAGPRKGLPGSKRGGYTDEEDGDIPNF